MSPSSVLMLLSPHFLCTIFFFSFTFILFVPPLFRPSPSSSPFHPLPLPHPEDGARGPHPRPPPPPPPGQSEPVVCLPRPPLGWRAAGRGPGTCVITEATKSEGQRQPVTVTPASNAPPVWDKCRGGEGKWWCCDYFFTSFFPC